MNGRIGFRLSFYHIIAVGAMLLTITAFSARESYSATALKTELVASGFNRPVFATSPPGDGRLFIVDQHVGQIWIIKNGSVIATPFLDIGDKVAVGSELGLLGLAFHPDYNTNGFFFVNYTRSSDNASTIERYAVSANPNIADITSGATILIIPQPFANHNGGMLSFGPMDEYLYISSGDGGSSGDPFGNAQDKTTLLGKILRIDVDGAFPYAIPIDNPYAGSSVEAEEIWNLGVRNPWRTSFDRETGDLYIADVGQGLLEEINFQPAGNGGGENYGWRCYEGNNAYNTTGCDDASNYEFPILEYSHSAGRCSITGGYVYRGCAIPDLSGTYFYADYCTGEIWSFEYDGVTVNNLTDRTLELAPTGINSIGNISSFGEDGDGEIYIVDLDGEIYKIVPDGVASACSSLCGDVNQSGGVNILDLTFIINYLYQGGPAPNPIEIGDVNSSGSINILDITYLIVYLYQNGPAPNCPQ